MKIGILGASGRMGIELIKEINSKSGLQLSAVIVQKNNSLIGQDAGNLLGGKNLGVNLSDNMVELCQNSDAVIDFSSPEATLEFARLNQQYGRTHVIGTTGFSEEQKLAIQDSAKTAPIVQSANMSFGVNMLLQIVQELAAILVPEDFDPEIVEIHHRNKKDAPSGTALLIGEAIAAGMKKNLSEIAEFERYGMIGERQQGKIGFSTIRGGDVVGEHSAIFAGNGERIEVSHKASDRSIFAKGAIKAAIWAQGKPFGYYTMLDVINCNNNFK